MFKGCDIEVGEVSLTTLVIGMALLASTYIRQAAMQAEIAAPLFDDIGMATFTPVGRGS